MSVRQTFRPLVSGFVVLCLMTAASGCFGPFNLTRNVYQWNSGLKGTGEVNEKWMKEIVFFGMIVIPVYMFSALLDAFVFNAIQFWSGSNPVKLTHGPDGFPEQLRAGDTTIQLSWSAERRSATLIYRRNGDHIKTLTIAAEASAYRMLDEGTEASAYRILDEGTGASYVFERDAAGMSIVDQDCRLVERIPLKVLDSAMRVGL
jgi:hypothetical protein